MAYEIPWQPRGGGIMALPIRMVPECPRKMKLGTQVLKGILKRYPKSFLQKTLLEKIQGPWKNAIFAENCWFYPNFGRFDPKMRPFGQKYRFLIKIFCAPLCNTMRHEKSINKKIILQLKNFQGGIFSIWGAIIAPPSFIGLRLGVQATHCYWGGGIWPQL